MLGSCHGQYTGRVLQVIFHTVLVKLPFDMITGASHAGTVGAAALDHKAADDSMKDQAVIKMLVDQADKVIYRDGGNVGIQFKFDGISVFHGNGNNWIFFHDTYPF